MIPEIGHYALVLALVLALIQATVPLLKSRGEEITRHFYRVMLSEHPELKAFFNEAHQAEGTQARALAGAVLAYASHIDRVHELADGHVLDVEDAAGVVVVHHGQRLVPVAGFEKRRRPGLHAGPVAREPAEDHGHAGAEVLPEEVLGGDRVDDPPQRRRRPPGGRGEQRRQGGRRRG